tara:strand:- start:4181 stop:4936 length:756 start_codon:yes stop_codon:yes gene_type:complete
MITVEPNKICYIFDVDGTLTEPRVKVKNSFAKEFVAWAKNKQLFISSGSDYDKISEQITKEMLATFKNLFCCMGNEVRGEKGKVISKSQFIIPDELNDDLSQILQNSAFSYRTGNHLEFRTGMLNFSIVGRNATSTQREEYLKWDTFHKERSKIADFINRKYPTLEASVGGSISIDIIELGCDKGQTIHFLENAGAKKVVFVGDRCYPGGNDYGIIRELKKSNLAFEWYQVENPQETLALLRTNKVFDGGK